MIIVVLEPQANENVQKITGIVTLGRKRRNTVLVVVFGLTRLANRPEGQRR
jgi:hypothetical protein